MNQEAWSVFAGVAFGPTHWIDTPDLDEAVARSSRLLGPYRLRRIGPGERPHMRMDHRAIGGLSLSRLSWGAAVDVLPDVPLDDYLLTLPCRGVADAVQAGRPSRAEPRTPALAGGGQVFRFSASADFEQWLLRFDHRAVNAAWAALTGSDLRRPIVFDESLPTVAAAWQSLAPTLALLAQALAQPQTPPGVATRLQEHLITTLLLRQPHSEGALLAAPVAPAAPRHLRRAEDWLREHQAEPVTLAALSQACGVPGRTLQQAFQRAHGQGPLQWLREQRLQAVRRALLAGEGNVTQCALAQGFSHLGEFSAAYRRRFGESPRQTRA